VNEDLDVAVAAGGVVELTQTLVRTRTVNPPGDEGLASELLVEALRGAGLAATVDNNPETGRPNVVGHFDTGVPGPHLVFNAHVDVVPPGSGWTHDPYGAEIVDGVMYGRGAADTKGGLAAIIVGIGALVRTGEVRCGRISVAAVADEEERQTGTNRLRETGLPADLVVVAEPTSLVPTIAHKGGALFSVLFTGVASHGSRPHLGINAIEHAARFISRVSEHAKTLSSRQHALLGSPTLTVSEIDGGFAAFAVPDRCRVTIDRRLIPGESAESARAELDTIITVLHDELPEVRAVIKTMFAGPPMDTSESHPLITICRRSVESVVGHDPGTRASGGGTDAGIYSTFDRIPAVVLGPGDVNFAHAADEHIPLAELENAALVFARIAKQALDGETLQPRLDLTA
jgi:acetylornithine deacetylase/succinyl-diaminopimelate desuccinylase family protein